MELNNSDSDDNQKSTKRVIQSRNDDIRYELLHKDAFKHLKYDIDEVKKKMDYEEKYILLYAIVRLSKPRGLS